MTGDTLCDKRSVPRKETMKEKIIALVEEILQVPAGTVTEHTRMEDVEQWDSLAHVMIIGALDEKLGISVDLEAAIEVTDMAALLALCEEAKA